MKELGRQGEFLPAHNTIKLAKADIFGNVYAIGIFRHPNLLTTVAKWDGVNWTKFGNSSGTMYIVRATINSIYGGYNTGGSTYNVEKVESNGTSTQLGTGASALNANNQIKSLATHNGNVYVCGMFFNASGNAYMAKWNGTSWSQLGTTPGMVTLGYAVVADTAGNVFSSFRQAGAYSYLGKWNGSEWIKLDGDNHYNFNGDITSLFKDRKENLYVAGGFSNDASNNFVAAYGESILKLIRPLLSSSPNQYCSASGAQTIKILNLGDTSRVHVLVKLDNSTLPVNADSSFSFTVSSLTPGSHRITVFFYSGTDSMYTIKDFVINPPRNF